jgi:hypothetical protein
MTSEMLIAIIASLLIGGGGMAVIHHFTSRAAPPAFEVAVERDAVAVIMEQIHLLTDNSGSTKVIAAENAKMAMRASSLQALAAQLATLAPPPSPLTSPITLVRTPPVV